MAKAWHPRSSKLTKVVLDEHFELEKRNDDTINEFIYDFGDRLKSRLFFFDRSVNYQVVSNYRFF